MYDSLTQKLYEVATSSKSQILMTIFMFWMFGNNISIFILFPIIQTLTTAVGGVLNMQKSTPVGIQSSSLTRECCPR